MTRKCKKYGYARVSTKEQKEGRQVSELLKKGVSPENIFTDKTSGKTFNRVSYNKMLKVLKAGDTLFIHSIDRLGRDYHGILTEWNKLTKVIKVKMKILDMPVLDTDKKDVSLFDTFIRDLTLLILAFQAEQEWINIKARQAKGIEVAKSEGKHLGRPKSLIDEESFIFIKNIINDWKQGKINQEQAMERLNKGRSTFYKLVKLYDARGGE